MSQRSSLQVTFHVWHAVFLRELMARLTADRLAAPWMILEPIIHVLIMIGIRKLIGSGRLLPGADFVPWLLLGIMAFFMFRDSTTRCMNAISANQALFAYRQVQPFDPVFIRAGLEGLLRTAVLLILLLAASMVGIHIIAHDPLLAIQAWTALWIMGFGLGLIFSVVVTVLPELSKIIPILLTPLYVVSGVMIPIHLLPHGLREWLLFNPILHGVESFRMGFFSTYHVPYPLDMQYLWLWSCSLVLLGLMLHVRYRMRLTAL